MEERLEQSNSKVIVLKENERLLSEKVKRLQSELFEFQKALLKTHNVPCDAHLPLASQG